ncbi:hypothetical protein [Cytobacillus oceanisediminis]|uniref:hypothetical protein n=1 Tax=Cytobacillus oceanisediminis TaxID=665099 RepID=UPI0025511867|nr:hypothetical protein [Cytobacillus oceanisediminis]MDK7669287.1 hypothetical protein [Cytobacillus oceanisediminis]
MARKNSKRTRIDSMTQWKQRSFKKKNSPQSFRDGRDWTYYTMLKLKGAADEGK